MKKQDAARDSLFGVAVGDALAGGFDLEAIAQTFKDWLHEDYWTPRGEVFDVGNITLDAIHRIANLAARMARA